jgi:hypothetical protein
VDVKITGPKGSEERLAADLTPYINGVRPGLSAADYPTSRRGLWSSLIVLGLLILGGGVWSIVAAVEELRAARPQAAAAVAQPGAPAAKAPPAAPAAKPPALAVRPPQPEPPAWRMPPHH